MEMLFLVLICLTLFLMFYFMTKIVKYDIEHKGGAWMNAFEHKKCGHVSVHKYYTFLFGGVCPNCGDRVTENDIRNITVRYTIFGQIIRK